VKIEYKLFAITMLAVMAIGLFGCNQAPKPVESIPETPPDPCAPQQIIQTSKPIQGLMRQYVDATDLAFSTPVEQLANQLARLQVLRDDLGALDTPECAAGLKTNGLQYMDATLELFIIFMDDPYSETVSYKLEVMNLHWDDYLAELSSLLGATLTPSPTPILIIVEEATQEESEQVAVIPTEIPSATETPAPSNTSTNFVPQIVVLAADGVTVRNGPGADFIFLTILPEGSVAQATGRNVEEAWIQIILDDASTEVGWVFSSQVELNIPIADLPIVDTP